MSRYGLGVSHRLNTGSSRTKSLSFAGGSRLSGARGFRTYRQKGPFNAACIFRFLCGHGGWGGGGLTDFDCLRRLTQVDKSAGHQLGTPTDFPTTVSLLASGCLPIIR